MHTDTQPLDTHRIARNYLALNGIESWHVTQGDVITLTTWYGSQIYLACARSDDMRIILAQLAHLTAIGVISHD